MADKEKKQIPLRLSAKLYDAIAAWAEDDFRSVNGQIEYLLTECVRQRKKNGKYVSLTTLRRVFADGSELNANNFNYESTLLPIAEVLLEAEDVPTPIDSPYAKEIDALKAVIHVQVEEIARLHDIKEHLESRIAFLLEQIERKDRRMDEKDEIIRKLMDKCLKEEK